MDFKTGCLFFPLLCATVRHRSLSFCFQLVIQVQPGDSFFLQLCFQEKTKSWHFSKLSIDCLRVGSVSTPSPAAGTLSKKGEIEQNTSQSWCYRPADKQGGTWPWKGMCSTKSKWRYQQNLQALDSWPCEAQLSICKEPFSISGTDGDCEAGWFTENPTI